VSAIKGFLESVGVDLDRVKEYEVPADDLAHYSKRTIDFEFAFPHGDELSSAFSVDKFSW
jgi:glycyl-tRNA synthetase